MKKILPIALILLFLINCKGEKPSKEKMSDEEEAKITSVINLMDKSRKYSDSAFILLDNNLQNGVVKKEIVDNHIILLEKSVEAAKKVDLNILEKLKKGFGKKYKQKYLRSLELQIEGVKEIDTKKSLDGQILYDEYVNYIEKIKK